MAAAQLAGLGVVAARHWEPSFGMGGGYAGEVAELERLGWLVAASGLLTGLAAIGQLRLRRLLPCPAPPRHARATTMAGIGLVILLPVAIGAGSRENLDASSLGAFALVYSLPWGLSVLGTRWLGDDAATAVLGTCGAASVCAVVGPQLTDLVFSPSATPAFTSTAVLLGVLLRGRWPASRPGPSAASGRTAARQRSADRRG